MANKTNVDAQKSIKKFHAQIQELQVQVEEEQRKREEFRENYLMAEKKLNVIMAEKDDVLLQREQLDQMKAKVESEVNDQRSLKHELMAENSALSAARRTIENDLLLTKVKLGSIKATNCETYSIKEWRWLKCRQGRTFRGRTGHENSSFAIKHT